MRDASEGHNVAIPVELALYGPPLAKGAQWRWDGGTREPMSLTRNSPRFEGEHRVGSGTTPTKPWHHAIAGAGTARSPISGTPTNTISEQELLTASMSNMLG